MRRAVAIGAVLFGLGAGLASPPPLAAQDTPIEAAEERYDQALQTYRAVLEQRDRALREHEILLDRHDDARRAGDEEQAREFKSRVHSQGTYVMRLEQEVEAVAEPLRQAGRELLRLLDAREEELLEALDRAILPSTRTRLQEELAALRTRYRQVERDTGTGLVPAARFLPDLGIGPRDGPQELRAKAGLMESWALQYDQVLDAVDREIETRERRIQQERGREDLMAGISRFGDDRLVGGGLGPPVRDEGGGTENGVDVLLNLAALPLPEQVAVLREYRETIAEFRTEALAQARIFRERAEGGSR